MCRKLYFLTVLLLVLGLAGTNVVSALTIEVRVSSGSDDAEEAVNAGAQDCYNTSSDLEIVDDTSDNGGRQFVGMTFRNIEIPPGAKIKSAYIEFTCDASKFDGADAYLLIWGHLTPNPNGFATPLAANAISIRPRTQAKVPWEPEPWTAGGQISHSSDISSIIQELINQNGWTSGNAIEIIIGEDTSKGAFTGFRCAESYNGSPSMAPLLYVELSSKYATHPTPADGVLYPDIWASLDWEPGETAASHDVYIGDNFTDVNDGTGDTFRGNANNTFFMVGFPGFPYPDGLVPGTAYYWRIDEVEADGTTKHKGPVWSFMVPSKTAYSPVPSDGMKFVAPDATLSWTAGFGSKVHYVYFGTSFDEVNDAAGALPQAAKTYNPGPLAENKTYYWRIDEFDGSGTHKGDVWSFKTRPVITITDPDLIGWWKFDEGYGSTALDWSGHENHGTLEGNPQWVEGVINGGINLRGNNYITINGVVDDITSTNISLSAWIKTTQANEGNVFAANDSGSDYALMFGIQGGNPYRWDGADEQYPPAVNDGQWHMLTYVRDGSRAYIYVDAVQRATYSSSYTWDIVTRWSIGQEWDDSSPSDFYVGMVDDVRFYNKALSQAEVAELTRGDLLVAWNPIPGNKATVDVEGAKSPLTWSPGDQATQHDVYFGTDLAAVEGAENTDTTGVFRGSQAGTIYKPTESLDWGTGPYYWRIDEINADGTVSTGDIWNFMVANHLIVEDFESYDSEDNQIWYAWHDGLGYGAPGVPPYFAGNGTGAAVGDENTNSYTEQTIVHSGGQSMPLSYDNNKQGFAKYSETEFTLTAPRDWTKYDVAELSIWFRGYPASAGSFVEGPVGTFTMTGSGADIWDQADEFHFAYKMLTGAGSIVARVQSVDNTNAWAKAGVMIRESLDPGSKYAIACVSATSGAAFQYRLNTDDDAAGFTQTGIAAPYWIKLERSISGSFAAYTSTNGTTWVTVTGSMPQNISMGSNVYVGLALTSHDDALTCTAKFSNVQIVGTVGPQWTNQDIGITSNDAEPLYVAVSNTSGTAAVVVNDDPAAAQADTWTEWVIPLQAFADQGINLANVDRIAIGLGTKGNMTVPGGAGKLFIDDIGLYQIRTAP